MSKKILLSLLFFFFTPSCALAQGDGVLLSEEAGKSAIFAFGGSSYSNPKSEIDFRYFRLFSYLKENNSPLADYSWYFIDQADYWGIDWRLLPAIAGLESNFGKRMLPNTFNAYGWGGGYIAFDNWYDSIAQVTKNLKFKYYDKGLDTPFEIAPVYAPPCRHWGLTVAGIMAEISSF